MSFSKTSTKCLSCPFAINCNKKQMAAYAELPPMPDKIVFLAMTPALYDEMLRRTFPITDSTSAGIIGFTYLGPSFGFTKGKFNGHK